MKQCAVLFADTRGERWSHATRLRDLGFIVHECAEWPQDAVVLGYQAMVIRVHSVAEAPMLAARLRAKPHFGRRLLFALVDRRTPLGERRALEASGFDDILNDCCGARALATRILRRIRRRPELRCVLPSSRRRAA